MDPGHPVNPSRAVTGSQFAAAARAYMGVPYRHQGRSRAGVDCLGLIVAAGNDLDLVPLDAGRRDYGRAPLDQLIQVLPQYAIRLEALEAGAIIAIKWPGDKRAAHVAICAGETMIHCFSDMGKVVEHGIRRQWLRWIDSIWWLKGLTHG